MKLPLLISVCLFSTFSYGQSKKISFKIGEEYELPRKSEDLAFFGNDKDGIINLSLKKEEINIVRFDPLTLRKTIEKKIDLDEATRNFNSERIVTMDNNYFWMHSDWDKSTETEMLFYDKIDVASGKLTEKNHKLFETRKLAGSATNAGRLYSFKLINKYKFKYDVEKKKLLVVYRFHPLERNDKLNYDKIGLQVFDKQMNKLWSNEYTMPYTEAMMDNSDFSVDSKGNAYLLTKVYDGNTRNEKDKITGKPGYHFEVFKFTGTSKNFTRTSINVDDYYVDEPNIIENSQHDMIIAGSYSKKAKVTSTDGIFLATLDQDGKLTKYKNGYYEFPLAEMEKFESARTKRKMEKKEDYENPVLIIRDVVVSADGSVFVACEESFSITNTYWTSNGGSTTRVTFYAEDIIAAKINPSGQFAWVRKVPKRQKSYSLSDGMGFKLINDTAGYYFMFLDNKKNMELAENEVPKYHINGKGGQVVVVMLDNNGNMKKELLFDTREEDVAIDPRDFTQFNSNQFIGRVTLKRNVFQPLLITVNQH